ncbi:MAG: hypothetical protein AAF557_02105 [Pseudomonadota bacterium]
MRKTRLNLFSGALVGALLFSGPAKASDLPALFSKQSPEGHAFAERFCQSVHVVQGSGDELGASFTYTGLMNRATCLGLMNRLDPTVDVKLNEFWTYMQEDCIAYRREAFEEITQDALSACTKQWEADNLCDDCATEEHLLFMETVLIPNIACGIYLENLTPADTSGGCFVLDVPEQAEDFWLRVFQRSYAGQRFDIGHVAACIDHDDTRPSTPFLSELTSILEGVTEPVAATERLEQFGMTCEPAGASEMPSRDVLCHKEHDAFSQLDTNLYPGFYMRFEVLLGRDWRGENGLLCGRSGPN